MKRPAFQPALVCICLPVSLQFYLFPCLNQTDLLRLYLFKDRNDALLHGFFIPPWSRYSPEHFRDLPRGQYPRKSLVVSVLEFISDKPWLGELIEHDMDLLSLLYGDRNYDAMDRYYSTLRDNNLQQLDSLKQQRDFWKQEWDEAVARGDSEAAKKFEEHYKDTIGNLNSLIEESA